MAASPASHYEILKVAPGAGSDALRRAYRQAAQQHHPDKHPGDPAAADRMAVINEAYAVLSHPQRRASYDRFMAARRQRERAERHARHARPSRFAASWPWGLVFATAVFAVGVIGTVLFKTMAPPVLRPALASTTSSLPVLAPPR